MVLCALPLADCVRQFYVDLSNFRRGTGTAVSVLLVELHVVVVGIQVLAGVVNIVVVEGHLGKCSCRPVKIRVH